jgi:tetraacyldisaccharide 4'-kinase
VNSDFRPSALRPFAWPFVPLYRAATAARNLAFNRGWKAQRRLRYPVICIGNISVGGSGKTPLTIRLAELLQQRGLAVDVLSRGYGRRSDTVTRVDPAGSADDFGDEPLLIAQSAQVPVYVGASRYAAGVLAEADSPAPRLHLLDDGFQHRQLARDIDIAVLHCADLSSGLLPAGRLREPLSSLSRAHFFAVREEDAAIEAELRRRGLHQPILWMRRSLAIPSTEAPIRRVVAFCAIARPEEFFAALRRQGVAVAATRSWRDHHRYTPADAAELIELLRRHQADAFFTTSKDLVRLAPPLRASLAAAAPLHAARLVLTLRDESAAVDRLLAALPAGWQTRSPSAEKDRPPA